MDGRHYGTALREARESRGLSISEVAKATRVPAQMLRHIEAGALGDGLPAPVYVRGFIRAYARLLRLPEDQPLRLFDEASCARRRAAEIAAATPVVRVPGKAAASAEDVEPAARPALGLAAFVVIVLVLATITLSFFLRQPRRSGEGLSRGDDRTPAGAHGAAARPFLVAVQRSDDWT